MAIEVSVQYITKRDRGRVAYCCFHFTVRDDFGPKYASQMLTKRNFSFPLGPLIASIENFNIEVALLFVKPKCILCTFTFIFYTDCRTTSFAFGS